MNRKPSFFKIVQILYILPSIIESMINGESTISVRCNAYLALQVNIQKKPLGIRFFENLLLRSVFSKKRRKRFLTAW